MIFLKSFVDFSIGSRPPRRVVKPPKGVRTHSLRNTGLQGKKDKTRAIFVTGWALDWFEVLGYRVVEDKATDYAHSKQALTEQFPVDRNRSELETRFFASYQKHNQKPSDFVHPQTTSNLLQIIDKYDERFLNRNIRGSSWEFRDTNPSEYNRFPNRNRQENWRETRGNNRYSDNSRPRREFNRFESQGVADNRRFDGRRRGGQSDHRFHNPGGRQGGSRNSVFRGQNA
ncbi:uncharacterized protein TNCV_2810831 [Trichonephila clavipes]|nr:uncharacterized protein TNCV_2810831 [Trichonephila clavipes]